MHPAGDRQQFLTRRHFFGKSALGIGSAALGSLLSNEASALEETPHFLPRAKRVIYLFQSGAPSQIDLFDEKPRLRDQYGQELPQSVRGEQRLTGMTADQETHPIAHSHFDFVSCGESGMRLSEVLPHTGTVADEICLIRSVHTEAINHDPAITFFLTGSERAGRPSFGSWMSYGLGSLNQNLPAFVVMVSQGTGRPNGQPLYERLWGSGFLPTQLQGIRFRSAGDPVLYLSDPPGLARADKRRQLDDLERLNSLKRETTFDPEIETRIAQYEMAYQMQTSVPDLIDLASEPEHIFEMYGEHSRTPGTFAANCLLARRLAERGVRFIQLFHRGWDNHRDLPNQLRGQCGDTDQASAALLKDLKQRGLLDDTLVIWGGEFGRTVYCQEMLTNESYGRDHHPRCFSLWMAGGGIRPGMTYGATDDYSYNIIENPISVHDLHATQLHCLGIDHKRLTFKFQGRHYRLTDVAGEVVTELLA